MFVDERGAGPAEDTREAGDERGGAAPGPGEQTVVFIPGLGADHRMYAPQMDALTEFRRLAVDLRGTGASGTLDGVTVADILTTQADELAAALRERGIGRAHLVGISYGGVIVQLMLLRHPGLVASGVICDSFCDMRPRSLAERLQMAGAHAQPAMLRLLPPAWTRASVDMVYRRRWPLAAKVMAQTFRRERLADLIAQRRAVNAVHLEEALAGVRAPVLCLVGDYSRFAVSMMRRTHEAIPGSEFGVIEGSFDPSSLCQPDAFTARVRAWTARHTDP